MLKGALTPHITDCNIKNSFDDDVEEDFKIVENLTKALKDDDPEKCHSVASKLSAIRISTLSAESAVEETLSHPEIYNIQHVPVPEIVQVPRNISALYSFNRTTVYQLLDYNCLQKIPKAVALCATSERGSLELEFPIQEVGFSETIHRLAAKKAVHELEYGRGWINEMFEDNKLLQAKYEGRRDLMVEREAIRLSTQFQASGKYCSFLVVEEDNEEFMASKKITTIAKVMSEERADKDSLFEGKANHEVEAQQQGLIQQSDIYSSHIAVATCSASINPFGNNSTTQNRRRRCLPGTRGRFKRKKGLSIGGKSSHRAMSFGEATIDHPGIKKEENLCEVNQPCNKNSNSSEQFANDKMQKLVGVQDYDGGWNDNEEFWVTIGLKRCSLPSVAVVKDDRTNTTALAVAWLETRMRCEEEVWCMIVDKAKIILIEMLGRV